MRFGGVTLCGVGPFALMGTGDSGKLSGGGVNAGGGPCQVCTCGCAYVYERENVVGCQP